MEENGRGREKKNIFKVWLPFEAQFSIQKVQDSKPIAPGPISGWELKGSDCTMLISEMVACFHQKKKRWLASMDSTSCLRWFEVKKPRNPEIRPVKKGSARAKSFPFNPDPEWWLHFRTMVPSTISEACSCFQPCWPHSTSPIRCWGWRCTSVWGWLSAQGGRSGGLGWPGCRLTRTGRCTAPAQTCKTGVR